MSLRFWTHFNC